jgi:hypothetical protein
MTSTKLPPNIVEFNEITAVIFAQLYDAHPISKDLDIDQIAGVLGRSRTETLPSGRTFIDVFAHTLPWLSHQGYIISNGSLPRERVQLTDKALIAMNAVPPSLAQSRGSELVDATKQASTTAGRGRLAELGSGFLSAVAEGVTKGVLGSQ